MNNKESEIIDISIRIGNSYDYRILTVGRTYDFRVCRGDSIYSLKQKFIGEFDESIQDEIKNYNIYNNRIIPMHDDNSINDAFSNPNMSRLDIIDKNEYLFYALTL